MGELDLVRAAIDRWKQPVKASRPELTALAQRGAHMWAVTFEPGKLLGPLAEQIPGGGGALQAIAASMQSLAIRATAVADGVNAEMAFRCADAADARSLADAAQTLAAFAALTAQRERPELADLAGKVQIHQDYVETTLSLKIPEKTIRTAGASLR
jgi:hypothetical protein